MSLPINQIINGECVSIMKSFPNHCVDTIITDPPQRLARKDSIKREKTNNPKWKRQRDRDFDFGEWDYFETKEDYMNFSREWLTESFRVLKLDANIVVFVSRSFLSHVGDFLEENGFKWRQTLFWIKPNPMPRLRHVTFANGVEQAIWCSRGKNMFNWDLGHSPNFFSHPILSNSAEKTCHPTQKPEKLIKWIMDYLTRTNDVVLDPFVGSGTTCAVAKKLGRRWIGIDASPKYYEVSRNRISSIPERMDNYLEM